jgi:hypothetical protein
VAVIVINHTTQATPRGRLSLFVQSPVAVLVDSARPARPGVERDTAGTWVRFDVAPLGAGQRTEIRQGIRTPPAPAPPAAPGSAPQPAPPAPRPPKPAVPAKPDTLTRFVVRARLEGDGGAPLAPEVVDTLRIRPESAVTIGGCGNAGDVVVTRYGIGPVRVGMPLDALRAACPEARDTSWQQEGVKETGLVVMPGGRRVLAVTSAGTVQRIVIDQPGLRTAAGVGVGSPVSEMRTRYGKMCSGIGEGIVAVWFPNAPGLSFGLDTAATKGWTAARTVPDSIPDTVAVGSMWVRRGTDDCPARPGEGPG